MHYRSIVFWFGRGMDNDFDRKLALKGAEMKNREAVTCNGRAAFYACMWDDIRQCAMDCGWAVALHGSLSSDMDIMAMPWTESAVSFEELILRIVKLFDGNELAELYSFCYNDRPHNRIVATIPIWEDFYLDISTIR